MQERLGRDAATMQAGAADRLLLDDCDLEPQLGPTDGADISGGAAANDGYVERLIGHTNRFYPPAGAGLTFQDGQGGGQLRVLREIGRASCRERVKT